MLYYHIKGEKIASNKMSIQFTHILLQQVYEQVLSDFTNTFFTKALSILQNKTLLGPKSKFLLPGMFLYSKLWKRFSSLNENILMCVLISVIELSPHQLYFFSGRSCLYL